MDSVMYRNLDETSKQPLSDNSTEDQKGLKAKTQFFFRETIKTPNCETTKLDVSFHLNITFAHNEWWSYDN